MKRVLLFVLILLLLAFTNVITNQASIVIAPQSKLFIEGKTNINSFKCRFNISEIKKPITVFYRKDNSKMVFENTFLELSNECFDCGGNGINSDFQELLKSDLYPNTYIILKEIDLFGDHNNCLYAYVDIDLAGVIQSYKVPVQLNYTDELHVNGVLNLNIRNFNLEPPKKALGLIVVKDIIEINFDLIVKELED